MNNRLIVPQDSCLMLQPCLVKKLGKSPAIVLQQIHYWLTSLKGGGKVIDGQKWVYNSIKDWTNAIKILSESTVKRSITILKQSGILLVNQLNPKKSDRTNWYAINYKAIENFHNSLFDSDLCSSIEIDPMAGSTQVKMTQDGVQSDHISYTEITRKNISLSSSQTEPVEREIFKKGQEIQAADLLAIWNEEVVNQTGVVEINQERAKHLMAAFKAKFQSCPLKWREYCHLITTSDFLMGKVNQNFRASIDWALRFDTIQKILEGQYGVKRRTFPFPKEILLQKLQESPQNSLEKTFKRQALDYISTDDYKSWFEPLTLYATSTEIVIQASGAFTIATLEERYGSIIATIMATMGVGPHHHRERGLSPEEHRTFTIRFTKKGYDYAV